MANATNRFGVPRFLADDVGSWVADTAMAQHLRAPVSPAVDQITVWDTSAADAATAAGERGDAPRYAAHIVERSYIRRTQQGQPGWERIK